MSSPTRDARQTANRLGPLLSHWRDLRGKSQMTLSFDSGVSQRHISFVESGRSIPSRQMLIDLAGTLDIPLRERNELLLAAGYAPIYSENAWDTAEMERVVNALRRMLRQHEPYPAVVMDRYWNVLASNDCASRFFNGFIDMSARKKPRNLLHLMFDPDGMRPFIANWEDVAKSLIQRVHRESIGRVIDDKTQELLDTLLAYPNVDCQWKLPGSRDATSMIPVVPISFVKHGKLMNYFSMVTTTGAPQTVAAEELRLECLFPADEKTEARHADLIGAVWTS
jgi:transcriptional regulator with XRE-family HTH domain